MMFASWAAAGFILAVLLARVAVYVQAYWAPLLLFPAICGALLGAGLTLLPRVLPPPQRNWLLIVATYAGLVFSAAVHGMVYLDYRLAFEKSPQAQLVGAVFPPKSLPTFLHDSAEHGRTIKSRHIRGRGVWLLWSLEALVAMAATVAVVYWRASPQPLRG